MEVARLETLYTANLTDFEQKSTRADARLKRTAQQAHTTERAVNRAFGSGLNDALRGLGTSVSAIGGPLGSFQSRLSSLAPIAGGLTTATGGLGVAVGVLGAIMVGATAAVVNFTISTAKSIDHLGDMAEKVNFSVRTISGLQTAIEASGGSLEGFTNALGIFDKNIEAAAQGDERLSRLFKALKIDATDNEAAFRSVAKVLIDLGGSSQQTALAMELFGRSGKDVLGVLKEAGGDVDAFIGKMEALGLVISDDAVKASDALDRELVQLRAQFRALSRDLAMDLIPSIRQTAQEMSASMGKNRDEVRSTIGSVLDLIRAIAKLNDFIMSINPIILSVKVIHSIINDKAAGGAGPGGSGANLVPIVPGSVYAPGPGGSVRAIPMPPDMSAEFAIAGGPGQFSRGAGPSGRLTNTLADRVRDLLRRGAGGGGRGGGRSAASDPGIQLLKQLEEQFKNLTERTELQRVQDRLLEDQYKKTSDTIKKRIMITAIEIDQLKAAQADFDATVELVRELGEKGEKGFIRARFHAGPLIEDLEKMVSLVQELGEKGERGFTRLRFMEDITRNLRKRFAGTPPEGERDIISLGGGSFVRRESVRSVDDLLNSTRERFTSADEIMARERERMRVERMREIAEDLGSVFADVFDSIGNNWESMWQDMAQIARNMARRLTEDLFRGLFEKLFTGSFSGSRSGGLVGSIVDRIFGGGGSTFTNLGGGSVFTPGGTGATRPRVVGGRAMGGPVNAGESYLVGERGPEIFRPKIAGWIDPDNRATQQQQQLSRLYLVDDERAAFERGATRREMVRVGKQMRKVGKLIPGF